MYQWDTHIAWCFEEALHEHVHAQVAKPLFMTVNSIKVYEINSASLLISYFFAVWANGSLSERE